MSMQLVPIDRKALVAMEAANAHAEECRHDWLRAMKQPDQRFVIQAALNYAEAANIAHLAREAYCEFVMETMETERLREGIEELAV